MLQTQPPLLTEAPQYCVDGVSFKPAVNNSLLSASKMTAAPDNSRATVSPKLTNLSSDPTSISQSHSSHDILLHNFQIKKKRYRVLLNCDHLVWEPLDARQYSGAAVTEGAKSVKETEYEKEQFYQRAAYGSTSNVLHKNEIIRVDPQNASKSLSTRTTVTTQAANNHSSTRQVEVLPAAQYLAIHYAERVRRSATDCNRWRVRTLTLFNSDPYVIRQWQYALTNLLQKSTRWRVQRLLVFINPYSGRRQGLQVYERHCKPLFQLAGIDASCIISQRANQIRDILLSHDLTPFDAVCCVGGDGTVAEMINGLLFRTMRDLGMDMVGGATFQMPKPRLPVGIIPAGSTDTVAYSMHGTADITTAAIHLVLGRRRGLDICSVRNRHGLVRFCASVLSYGYLGDVAAKSEKYRWMGTKRYEYVGVKSFLLNRGYEAELRVLLTDREQISNGDVGEISEITDKDPVSAAGTICYADCHRCSRAELSPRAAPLQPEMRLTRDANDSSVLKTLSFNGDVVSTSDDLSSIDNDSALGGDSAQHSSAADCDINVKALAVEKRAKEEQRRNENGDDKEEGENMQRVAVPFHNIENADLEKHSDASEPATSEPHKWKLVRGRFFMISGANITCACSRSPSGISRYNHLSDGYMELILVRKTNVCNNVRLLINTMTRNGDIRNLPFVEVYRTKHFSFHTPYSVERPDDEYSIRGSCLPIVDEHHNNRENDNSTSRWNCDGEVLNDLDITMSSHCQLIDVFMRGPNAPVKPTKTNEGFCRLCSCCKHSDN